METNVTTELASSLQGCLWQMEQMKGMFPDEDGTIKDSMSDGYNALEKFETHRSRLTDSERELVAMVDYILEHERDSFEGMLLESPGGIGPLNMIEDDWTLCLDEYTALADKKKHLLTVKEKEAKEELFDKLALSSDGHVYCDACRVNEGLVKMLKENDLEAQEAVAPRA